MRVTGVDGVTSAWSEPARRRAPDFLADGEWAAPFVGLADPHAPRASPPCCAASSTSTAPSRRATLYATAQGVYQAELNGIDVDDEVLKPGWTAYQYRLVHETTDVTALLARGRQRRRRPARRRLVHRALRVPRHGPAVLRRPARVRGRSSCVEYDGRHDPDGRDRRPWRASGDGPIVAQRHLRGRDLSTPRRRRPGWSGPGSTTPAWPPVAGGRRRAASCPSAHSRRPVRAGSRSSPVREVITTPIGRTVLDFGQNLVGRLRIRVAGERGHESCSGTPRCSSTASSASARCAPPTRTDHYMLAAAATRSGSRVHVPRLPLRRGRRLARRARPGRR